MFLEINNQGRKTQIPLKGVKELTLGRSPRCDVQVVADGISREHLKLIYKDETYFIIDLNTTNGTFINDEQVTPDEEITFTTFFPIRVGFHVTISLVDQAVESKAPTGPGAKRSRASVSTKKGLKTVQQEREEEEADSGKESKPYGVILVILGVVGYFAYTNYIEPEMNANQVVVQPKVVKQVQKQEPVVQKFTEQEAQKIVYMDKCLADTELELCNLMQSWRNKEYLEGYVMHLGKLYYVSNISSSNDLITNSFKVNNQEIKLLARAARTVLRSRFKAENFKEQNYLVKKVPAAELPKLSSLAELKLNGFFNSTNWQNIESLTYIYYESQGTKIAITYFKEFSKEQLNMLKNDLDFRALMMARNHGHSRPVNKFLRKILR
jgi:DNA mismatch repair ATPase MutL